MNRIDRLTAILIQLQSQRITKAQEVADRFGISLRTVYRDIRALEEAGVPIGSEAGIGYFLANGYRLPPVMFTPEEARALLTAHHFINTFTDAGVQQAFESALFKIKSVLPSKEQDMLEDLQDKVKVVAPSTRSDHPDDIHLSKIQQAMMQRQVIAMEYFSPGSGEFTNRSIEPIGVVYYGDAWHVIAYCQLRQDYRDFRLDRMSKVNMLSQHYHLRDKLSLEQYLQQQSQTTDARLMKVRFDPSFARYTTQTRYSQGFVQEEKLEDGVEMWFMVGEEGYFARWLLMYTYGVKIIEPESLKNTMRKLVGQLQHHL
ncbi:helix-turn-helix transcriptional regulator [Catalinimonas niigatensis]|uniref:helix-turn-helix transcriptional regulator n=1 Tax=Catalinimonas niigatensis TaxID=1397264 RepID=UPI00266611EF|nr:YafY family protein [Catalinimonas niigatensis]WPP48562.1 YafY family protein [Catalinimonas niigatensis]